jgi:ABC-type glycerol-3-phosphate transport system substrate-binding protein
MSGDYLPPARWRRLLSWNGLGILVVTVAVTISLWQVAQVRRSDYSDQRVVVRMLHWQLEAGYREALQLVIDDYNHLMADRYQRGEIPKPIEVMQVAVSEKIYGQVVNTNLLAREAPDLISMGDFALKSCGAQKAQHFLCLDELVRQPNPYNAPSYLAGAAIDPAIAAALPTLPWRDTFIDGMRGAFDDDLQGFYAVPTNFYIPGRLSYNKDLLKAATGSEEPPQTFGQLLDICAKVKAYGERQGRRMVPIAGTRANLVYVEYYLLPFLASYRRSMDLNRDGMVSPMEGWAALGSGAFDFHDKPFRELAEASQALAAQFPSGFLALERDTGVYLYTQGEAAFHLSGSWDAGTLYHLTEGKFRMGIVPFPLPGPGERWGDPPKIAASEAGWVGGNIFGVYKYGHTAEAVDFLRYLTSWVQNQRCNRACDWGPNVIGTSLEERMQAFAPRLDGLQQLSFWAPIGPIAQQVGSIYRGQMQALLGGEATIDQVIDKVMAAYHDDAIGEPRIWAKAYEDQKTYMRTIERTLSVQALVARLSGADRQEAERRYRTLLSNQVMTTNAENLRLNWHQTIGTTTGKSFPEPMR